MLVDQVNGALNTLIDERKKEKTMTTDTFDQIVKIYTSVNTPSHDYYNAIISYNQYKASVPINIQDANGDLIDIKIQDYYSAIKLPINGNITTTGHITIFHLMQPIIPYSNIIFKLTFRKLTTPEKSNIGKRLISKLSECEFTFREPAFREGNSPDMQAPNLRVINGDIPRDLDLTNISNEKSGQAISSYNIIIFSETSDNNKEITIKTIHPITIISYKSNVNIQLIYVNPPNDNCPTIEPVQIPNYRNEGTPLKSVSEFTNSFDTILKNIDVKNIYMQDIDKLINEYDSIDTEDKEINIKNFYKIFILKPIKTRADITDIDNTDMIAINFDRFSDTDKPKNNLNKKLNENHINMHNIKCHLCVFSFTNPKMPYSNIKIDFKLNKKDTEKITPDIQRLVYYIIGTLGELSLKTNSILYFSGRAEDNSPAPQQIDLIDINDPSYSIILFDNIDNKNVIINTIHPITIMSFDSDINIQLTYVNPYTDGPNPLCPVCPACSECAICKTSKGSPVCPKCKKCASCGKKKKK